MKPYGDAYVELIARRLAECYGKELGKAYLLMNMLTAVGYITEHPQKLYCKL